MKTHLRFALVAFLMALSPLAASGQTAEPTINSTLDNIEIIKLNTDQVFDLFITAGDRAGEPVQVRMVLNNPADRNAITLAYNYSVTAPNFVEAGFNAQGVAILGEAGTFMNLEDMRVYVRIRISELGTYGYTFELYRGDLNVIASVEEEVTVAQNVPASIRSTLFQNPNIVKGTNTDFYVELKKGELESDTPVRVRMTLDNKAQAERMTLQVQEGNAYTPLPFNSEGVAVYGPTAGFPLTDSRVNFRATFANAALYPYKLEIVHAATGAVLATRNETAAVNNVAGLPDEIDQERIRIYPTLATNGFVVLDLGNVQQAQVQVHDALGRTVLQLQGLGGINHLSTAGMASGLYFVRITKGDQIAGGRFVVR